MTGTLLHILRPHAASGPSATSVTTPTASKAPTVCRPL